ncbi:MAG: nucleoside-diphosphate sugar epimerase/dehydratase [Thermodesulfovibrionales bacterium]|nr:nucleoside-diphosphate sugar epimerase/dehydratase [Thermodesulfovibrionales bacterium]
MKNEYRVLIVNALPFFLIIKLVIFSFFRLYRITWRFVGLNDLYNIVNAIVVSESLLIVLILTSQNYHLPGIPNEMFAGFPRSVFLIDGMLSFLLLAGLRISKRVSLEIILKKRSNKQGKRTIIVGAGNTGEMIIRDMAKQGYPDFYPVGLLDDDEKTIGTYIHGVRVLAKTDRLKAVLRKYKAEAVIIAIPSLNYKTLRRIYEDAKEAQINTIKIVPRIYDFQKPIVNTKDFEDIHIEDLIGRQAVEVNYDEIEIFLKNTCVLITGAGGSIGSEIAMQVCAFQPQKVILFDIDETDLHNMHLKLMRVFPQLKEKLFFVTGDIRDEGRIEEVFKTFRPQLVFHSAAYKHVPMMEYNPKEAVKVNMLGTYLLARSSIKYGIKKFILISTDKAVRPVSVMGATKRVAEYICTALNDVSSRDKKDNGKTEFISVRFGNVLGSRGSVLPLFMEQLKYGGPLTVTHKEMQRYFMTIPEAVSLVLQASVIGKAGDVLVLDMGEPVKIVELAEELIRIHGMKPYKDVNIEFIGLRPGEKLFEEILTAEEGTVASKHERIFIAKNSEKYSMEAIENILKEFDGAIKESLAVDGRRVRDLLKKYVRHFE